MSRRADVLEAAAATLLVWLCYVAVPVAAGGIGLSWDSVNHHLYLGWSAEQPRFGLDYMATGLQAYQYPYLYWPVYRMAMDGFSGVEAGIVLATLAALYVPALWLVARVLVPEASAYGCAMRLGGTLFGGLAPVVLKTLEVTSNDLIAAVPVVWAYALALTTLSTARESGADAVARRRAAWVGALAGAAVAGKLSSGPLLVGLPLLYAFRAGRPSEKLQLILKLGASAVLSFLVLYGYWGWQLWIHFGNPFHPFASALFESLNLSGGSAR